MYYASETKPYMTKEDIASPMWGIIMWVRVQLAEEICKCCLGSRHTRIQCSAAVVMAHTWNSSIWDTKTEKSQVWGDLDLLREAPKTQAKRKD